MKKQRRNHFYLCICISASLLYGMDHNSNLKQVAKMDHNDDLKQVAKIVISNTEELAKYVQNHHTTKLTDHDVDAIHIDAELFTQLMGAISLGKDEPTPMHDELVKSIRKLPSKNPEQSRRHKRIILDQARKHDGNLSARAISERKKMLSSSSPEVTPKAAKKNGHLDPNNIQRSSLALNLDFKNNPAFNAYDEDFAKAKQEMRELMLDAAKASLNNKDQEAKRNLVIAFLGLIGTISGPIITYFTSNANDTNDCPPTNCTES